MKGYSEPDAAKDSAPTDITYVEFDDVRFSYDTSDEEVLRDMPFTVGRGELIAFVGQSSAGESTIISLFARMYNPDAGETRVDWTATDEIPIEAWRDRISIVFQDPFIFNEIFSIQHQHRELRCNSRRSRRGV